MKLLLVIPPGRVEERLGKFTRAGSILPSLGLAYIAASAEEEGHKVKIIDCEVLGLNYEQIGEEIRSFSPDVVGMQTFITNTESCLNIAEMVKRKIDKEIKIVLGGAQVTIIPESGIESKYVDFVVVGEGEITIKNLLRAIEFGDDLKAVNGIIWKNEKGGDIVKNPLQDLIKNLDNAPIPAWHLLPMDKYYSSVQIRGKRAFNIMTSRGCPFKCAFCAAKKIFGTSYRYHSPERVIREINYLIDNYGADSFQFYDDSFTLNKKRAYSLCDAIIKNGRKIQWTCYTRVDLVDKNLLKKMKEAGCYQIFYGAETGIQRLLDLLNKGITIEQLKEVFKFTKEIGIEVQTSFMMGLPNESVEEAYKTIDFALELDPDYAYFPITTPFPGTELYDIAKEYGTIIEEDISKYNTWSNVVYVPNGRSVEEIEATTKLAFKKFYIRPRYVLKRVWKLRHLPVNKIVRSTLELYDYFIK